MPLFSKQALLTGLTVAGLGYGLFIVLLTVPVVQRKAFYANNVNPAYFQNVSDVEQFGFLQRQVQPFTVTTADEAKLYAWHILPAHVYLKNEQLLNAQSNFGLKDSDQILSTAGFKLLLEDPSALVVVSFHGNAAHLGSAQRPATYQQMLGLSTPKRPVHVIAFDYRGFGLSTGKPTEEGVIEDGLTIASFLTGLKPNPNRKPGELTMEVAPRIAPSRIVLLGQSLGTATSTGLYHAWALRHALPPFRGLVLMASFRSLPTLLHSYSMKGITPPMLSPLNWLPSLQQRVLATIVDTWETERRIRDLVAAPGLLFDLTILHAKDDGDIPWREGWRNWEAAESVMGSKMRIVEGEKARVGPGVGCRESISEDGTKRVRWEGVRFGEHNKVATSEQARLAVLRVLERD